MAIYRKNNVEIEAIKLEDNDQSIINALKFMIGFEPSVHNKDRIVQTAKRRGGLIIVPVVDLKYPIMAYFGDYIIKDRYGDTYPCKPNIFEKAYHLVQVKE